MSQFSLCTQGRKIHPLPWCLTMRKFYFSSEHLLRGRRGLQRDTRSRTSFQRGAHKICAQPPAVCWCPRR